MNEQHKITNSSSGLKLIRLPRHPHRLHLCTMGKKPKPFSFVQQEFCERWGNPSVRGAVFQTFVWGERDCVGVRDDVLRDALRAEMRERDRKMKKLWISTEGQGLLAWASHPCLIPPLPVGDQDE